LFLDNLFQNFEAEQTVMPLAENPTVVQEFHGVVCLVRAPQKVSQKRREFAGLWFYLSLVSMYRSLLPTATLRVMTGPPPDVNEVMMKQVEPNCNWKSVHFNDLCDVTKRAITMMRLGCNDRFFNRYHPLYSLMTGSTWKKIYGPNANITEQNVTLAQYK
jgi:hypothetical protein